MTRDDFVRFIESGQVGIFVYPFHVAPCDCGDVNCQGWRLVPADVPPPPQRIKILPPADGVRRLR